MTTPQATARLDPQTRHTIAPPGGGAIGRLALLLAAVLAAAPTPRAGAQPAPGEAIPAPEALVVDLTRANSADDASDLFSIRLLLAPRVDRARVEIRAYRLGPEAGPIGPVRAARDSSRDAEGRFLYTREVPRGQEPVDQPSDVRDWWPVARDDLALPVGLSIIGYEVRIYVGDRLQVARPLPMLPISILPMPVPRVITRMQPANNMRNIVNPARIRETVTVNTRYAPLAPAPAMAIPQAQGASGPSPYKNLPPLPEGTGDLFPAAIAWVPRPNLAVYYATDRKPTGRVGTPGQRFGDEVGDRVSYGSSLVRIPVESHIQGRLELPTWWNLGEDPNRTFAIEATSELTPEAFRGLRDGLSRAGRGDVLVYVHGFNTSFDFATLKLAQVTHDVRFPGMPVVFSWPSRGSALKYPEDEAANANSVGLFARFLGDLIRPAGGPRVGAVHILAHSMGNRLVLRGLDELAAGLPADARPFGHILLAAPDVDGPEFLARAPTAQRLSRSTTLYYNRDDRALQISMRLHAVSRAGQGPVPLADFANVDALKADTSYLSHGYFGNTKQLLQDFTELIHFGWPADRRTTLIRREIAGPPRQVVFQFP